jgi:6-phospho-beta-glucosidase
MEVHCPQAWLVDFANPVPVVSAVVNNHTRIRALGVCGGYTNHQWDLTRLQGRDEQEEGYDVDVAGVNHGSLILRGTYKGEDLWQIFERLLREGWQEPAHENYGPWLSGWVQWMLPKMLEMYRKHGCTIFSTEGDGVQHYFYEEMWERGEDERVAALRADVERGAQAGREARAQSDREFQALAQGDLPADYWEKMEDAASHIQTRIARALGGGGEQKIVVSFPGGGRVEGFKDRTVLEYSIYLGPEGVRPVPNLAVPEVFQGLITALATHQTLLGDAIATEDPCVLYEALLAYPVHQNTRAYWTLCEALLDINREEIAETFQGAQAYFW